jgi:uncharacterized membrane protein YdjX (TVP38/TMEM64 family)
MADAPGRLRRRAPIIAGGCAVAALLAALLWATTPLGDWALEGWDLITDPEAIRESAVELVESAGVLGPIVFVAIQAGQVIISPIPGEATGVLGGVLFGTWLGFFYSTIGLSIGSFLAFMLGHLLGAPLVQRIGGPRWHQALDFVGHTGGEVVSFILFLTPGFPKDYLSYLLGLSPMPLRAFIVISTLGRMPGTWLLSATGAGWANDDRTFFWILLALMGLIGVIAFLFRDKILEALRHASHRPPSRGARPE